MCVARTDAMRRASRPLRSTLVLILGIFLTALTLAVPEGRADEVIEKMGESIANDAALGDTARGLRDAAAKEAEVGAAVDAARMQQGRAGNALRDAKQELDRAERRSAATRHERLQRDADVQAARNKVREAEEDLAKRDADVEAARQAQGEAQAETEALRKRQEDLREKLRVIERELKDLRAKESQGRAEEPGQGAAEDTRSLVAPTVGAAGGPASTTLDTDRAEMTRFVAQAVADGWGALAAMAAALKDCDAKRFEAARALIAGPVIGSDGRGAILRRMTAILDVPLAFARAEDGRTKSDLRGVLESSLGALNWVGGRWKLLELLWVQKCGGSAVCATPPAVTVASGGVAGAPPPRPTAGPPDAAARDDSSGPCPPSPELAFYQGWLAETQAQIREREATLADPGAGPETKATATRQLQDLSPWRDYLSRRIEQVTDEVCRRHLLFAREQAQRQAGATQLRSLSPGEELDRSMKLWQLQNFRNALDALRARAQQVQDSLDALQRHITTIEEQIAALQGDAKAADRISQLSQIRNGLVQSLMRRQQVYRIELAQLVADYQRQLWIVDPRAVRLSQIQRVGEYRLLRDALVQTQQTRRVSEIVFQTRFTEVEGEIARAEAAGDSARAAELRQQLANMKAGKQDWDTSWESRERRQARALDDMQVRNALDGVGPRTDGEFEAQWKDLGFGGDPTGPVLTDADRALITDIVLRYASGAATRRTPDDSRPMVVRFAGDLSKALMKETFWTVVDPRYGGAKTWRYTVGVVKGTWEGVSGFGQLVLGAGDVLAESVALAAGFQDGGVFGTDALATLQAVVDQATPAALVKATIAAGKVVDDTVKTGDLEMVGRVVGNVVVADQVLAPVVAGAAQASREMVAGIAGRVETAVGTLRGADGAGNVARTTSIGARGAGEVTDVAKAGGVAADAGAPGGRGTTIGPDAPGAGTTGRRGAIGPRAPPDATTAPVTPEVRPDATTGLVTPRAPAPSDHNAFAGQRARIDLKDGPTREMVLGDELNRGRDARVYTVSGDPRVVAKVYGMSERDLLAAARQGGRDNPIAGTAMGDSLLGGLPAEDAVAFTRIRGFGRLPDGRAVLLLDRVPGEFLFNAATGFTAEMQEALRLLFEKLRRHGLVMADFHLGNFYFYRDETGKLVAGILDLDGVVPLAEADTHSFVRGIMSGIQREITEGAAWSLGARDRLLEMLGAGTAADFFDVYAIRLGYIRFDPATGRFVDGLMTVQDWAKMNPDGLVAKQPALVPTVAGAAFGAPGAQNAARAAVGVERRVPLTFTGAGLAGGATYNLSAGDLLAGGAGPFSAMTAPHLMCWSRLYPPVFTPWGLWLVPFDSYDPAFFKNTAGTPAPIGKKPEVVFVEPVKIVDAQRPTDAAIPAALE